MSFKVGDSVFIIVSPDHPKNRVGLGDGGYIERIIPCHQEVNKGEVDSSHVPPFFANFDTDLVLLYWVRLYSDGSIFECFEDSLRLNVSKTIENRYKLLQSFRDDI